MLLRYTLRSLAKQPPSSPSSSSRSHSASVPSPTIVSVVESVWLRPLPYRDADRVVMVWGDTETNHEANTSGADLLDWEDQAQSFDGLAGFTPRLITRRGRRLAREARRESRSHPTSSTSWERPLPADAPSRPGPEDANAVVLAHEYWTRAFGSRDDVIGTTLRLDDHTYEVIGVAPAGFEIPFENADVWTRASDSSTEAPDLDFGVAPEELRGLHWLRVFGRLSDGVTLKQANEDIAAVAARLEEAYPEENTGPQRARGPDPRSGHGRSPSGHADARGRGGAPAVDRLRQRGQPSARACLRPSARDRGPIVARREPGAHRRREPDRESRARARRRSRRCAARLSR